MVPVVTLAAVAWLEDWLAANELDLALTERQAEGTPIAGAPPTGPGPTADLPTARVGVA